MISGRKIEVQNRLTLVPRQTPQKLCGWIRKRMFTKNSS